MMLRQRFAHIRDDKGELIPSFWWEDAGPVHALVHCRQSRGATAHDSTRGVGRARGPAVVIWGQPASSPSHRNKDETTEREPLVPCLRCRKRTNAVYDAATHALSHFHCPACGLRATPEATGKITRRRLEQAA